ncbi:MAG: reverse transcriptase domain-containing protein, partial [Actinomycetota bacterium]|nr:reverse transcriptase domain-containing protein [Actinomycetota bacterium]
LGKSLESVINNRLNNHLSTNKLLNPNQSGFRKNRCGLDQLARLDRYARQNKEHKKETKAAFLDLEKAYDTLWREGLLIRLLNKGVRGKMFNYVQDFLTKRQFKVRVGGADSENRTQESGVPQGAVLSPALFNVMIDMVYEEIEDFNKETLHKIELGQYADDIALWCSDAGFKSNKAFSKNLISAVERVTSLLTRIGFRVNGAKTQLITFFPRYPKKTEIEPDIGENKVEVKQEIKYLGVIMDRFLNYSTHIKDRVEKASKSLNVLRYLSGKSWGSDPGTLRTIYLCLVRATLGYGQELYDSSSPKILKEADTVQNRALRCLTRCPKSTSIGAMEIITSVPPLAVVRQLAIANFWTKIRTIDGHPLQIEFDTTKDKLARSSEDHQPMVTKYKSLLKDLHMDDVKLAKIQTIPYPWSVEHPEVDLGLCPKIDKKTTNPVEQKQTTLEYVQTKYPSHLKIYTDGSKLNGKTAIGIDSKEMNIAKSKRIDDETSITSAEMYAIQTAVADAFGLLENGSTMITKGDKILILTDSKASAQSVLADPERNNRGDVIRNILAYCTWLQMKYEVKVTLLWIPAHCDITGNERADALAKQGTEKDTQTTIGITAKEFSKHFKRKAEDHIWQKRWLQQKTETKKYLPHVRTRLKKVGKKLIKVLLNRPRFRSYNNSMPCLECNREKTVSHVLVHCKKYRNARELLAKALGKPIGSLEDFLAEDVILGNRAEIEKYINSINEEF